MIQIELTKDEAEKLKEILQAYLSDLRMEVADTDRKDFRDMLKENEVFLKVFLTRIKAKIDAAQ